MLTYKNLVELETSLRGRSVLSVYVNGEEPDPAKRRRWRVDLRNSLNDIQSWLEGSSHAEREAFLTCRRMLLEQLDAMRGIVRGPGWAGFYTTDGASHTGPVPAPVPTMAVWSTGPCLTPYVRALKESRPVVVMVADGRKVRIFRYAARAITAVETIHAKPRVEHPTHMGAPPRPGFHTGTRGTAGADEAQRELHEGTMHMLHQAVNKVAQLATDSAFIVVGGIPTVARALLRLLPMDVARAMHAERLDVHATKAEVAEVARQSASLMRNAEDSQLIGEALAGAAGNGRGVTGSLDTQRALAQGRARDVYFTQTFLENHSADAEVIVRLALGTQAQVEHVSGVAAARLDEVGGIAARLRYATTPALI
jgi:release factor family 10